MQGLEFTRTYRQALRQRGRRTPETYTDRHDYTAGFISVHNRLQRDPYLAGLLRHNCIFSFSHMWMYFDKPLMAIMAIKDNCLATRRPLGRYPLHI